MILLKQKIGNKIIFLQILTNTDNIITHILLIVKEYINIPKKIPIKI